MPADGEVRHGSCRPGSDCRTCVAVRLLGGPHDITDIADHALFHRAADGQVERRAGGKTDGRHGVPDVPRWTGIASGRVGTVAATAG